MLRPPALAYLYRRRLRVHGIQELLAGLGVSIAVALALAAMIANGSIAGSARQIVHAVVGPADLQLHARGADGLNARLLGRVERLPGVERAAPLLEQTATIVGPGGRRVTIGVAGTDLSLAILNGLAHTLPLAAFSPGGIAVSSLVAQRLGVHVSNRANVTLEVRGQARAMRVAAVLGREAAGSLAQAPVAVMPLGRLQQLAGLPGRLSRVLVQSRRGHTAAVRAELRRLAGGRAGVMRADADIALLHQALRPSDQASGFFAAISVLLGSLFAFNAMLLTVPERRQAIADLRLIGTKRSVIVQIVMFQALCLGVLASGLGLLAGYALSLGAFHQSSGYLAEAFTLGTNTVVGARPLLVALAGGIVATFLASAVPLLDLRRGRALDAVYVEEESAGDMLGARTQTRLAVGALALLALATLLSQLRSSFAFVASGVLALATMLAVPLTVGAVLRLGRALSDRFQRLTTLQVALTSLKAATVRSLALAATGAVAIFGGIALGGSRDDLLRGIDNFAHSYASDAPIWVTNPSDNQATVSFTPDRLAARIERVRGVAGVTAFQGGFLELGDRRAWVIARPPGAQRNVLASQLLSGALPTVLARLGQGGWAVVSEQVAAERHLRIGHTLVLPTPSGARAFRLAGTTTNLAWSPGAIFMSSADYRRLWSTDRPTALGVTLAPGADPLAVRANVARALGPHSGLAVSTATAREHRIDTLTSEGLSRLGEISTMLIVAAILAMSAALASNIWQRRASLAGLRLAGVGAARLRRILLTEVLLMLGAGCATGAVAGIYGQAIIDGYLRHTTGFPVANLAASRRPLEILVGIVLIVLAIVAVPGWSASRVSPTLALDE